MLVYACKWLCYATKATIVIAGREREKVEEAQKLAKVAQTVCQRWNASCLRKTNTILARVQHFYYIRALEDFNGDGRECTIREYIAHTNTENERDERNSPMNSTFRIYVFASASFHSTHTKNRIV